MVGNLLLVAGLPVSDGASSIALGPNNTVFIAGFAFTTNFPVSSGAYQRSNKVAANNAQTAFVAKLDLTKVGAASLIYATYLGGGGHPSEITSLGDQADAIAVDATGHAYVAGFTYSSDFPVFPDPGAYQVSNNQSSTSYSNGFVSELSPDGSALIYSTYINGSTGTAATAIALVPGCLSACNAYVAGYTNSSDFQTVNAYQSTNPAGPPAPTGFVLILNGAGSQAVYASYLGGHTVYGGLVQAFYAIAADSTGIAYVAGSSNTTDFPTTSDAYQPNNNAVFQGGGTDAVVAKIDPTQQTVNTLVYSSFLGGGAYYKGIPLSGDTALAIAVDGAHRIYLAGTEESADFPLLNPLLSTKPGITVDGNTTTISDNGFVSVMDPSKPTAQQLVYSTYLGGNSLFGGEGITGIALDGSGKIFVGGITSSTNFPVTASACYPALPGTLSSFVTELDPTQLAAAQEIFSSYFGTAVGPAIFGVALDSADHLYLAGGALLGSLPVTPTAYQTNLPARSGAFVSELDTTSSFCMGLPGRGRVSTPTLIQIAARRGKTGSKSVNVTNTGRDPLALTMLPVAPPSRLLPEEGTSRCFRTSHGKSRLPSTRLPGKGGRPALSL